MNYDVGKQGSKTVAKGYFSNNSLLNIENRL